MADHWKTITLGIAFGFGLIAAIILASMAARHLAKQVAHEAAGGDAIAYFTADPKRTGPSSQEVQMWINATGPLYDVVWWVSPAAAQRDSASEEYWSMRDKRGGATIVRPGGYATALTLPMGVYNIEFSTRSGSWVEHLMLGVDGFQSVVIERDGKGYPIQ